jgi:hypothetical protein
MDRELRKLLDEHTNDIVIQCRIAGITPATVKIYILGEMATAIDGRNWEAWSTLLAMTRAIEDPEAKAEVLNGLLVMPGHELHQEVTMEIQRLKSASSVPFIRSVLRGGFGFLAYTSSEDEVIAKWFSHALAKIGTPEAIEVIREFSVAGNAEIAEEMSYRLRKLTTDHDEEK